MKKKRRQGERRKKGKTEKGRDEKKRRTVEGREDYHYPLPLLFADDSFVYREMISKDGCL